MVRSLTFVAAILAFAVTMIGTTLPTPLYPLYQQAFGFSQLTITVIFAAYAFGVMGALLAFGPWSDQLGRRPVLLAGLGISLISDMVFWQAEGLGMLLSGRILSGMSAGIFTAAATVAVIEAAPPRWREQAPFFATAANMGGLGLGPMMAGALAEWLPSPLTLPYLLHSGLLVLAGLGLWQSRETANRPSKVRLRRQQLAVPAEVRSVFLPAAMAGFAGFAVCGFFTSLAPAMMSQVLGHDHLLAIGVVAGSIFIASIAGQWLQGLLPDGWRLPGGCLVLAAGTALVALGLSLPSLVAFMGGAILAGTGQGMVFRAGLGAIVAASPADQKASVSASFFIVSYIAISIPVVGIGLCATFFPLRNTGIGFALLVGAIAVTDMLLVLRLQRRGAPGEAL